MSIVTAENLINWIDTAGKTGPYDYVSNTDCAVAQFLKDRYPDQKVCVGASFYCVGNGDEVAFSESVGEAVLASIGNNEYGVRTFEALRARLVQIVWDDPNAS